jgi:CHAT domain-containing protein
MKGIHDSCREILEATTGKNLPTRHNEGGLPSPGLVLPHPHARVPVFSPFKSFLSGDFGRKKCRDPNKPGDELIGLTRALIYAGTPSVIVSLWAVEDISTGLLMEHFYHQLRMSPEGDNRQPITKVEALQKAQIHVMNLTATNVIKYCSDRLAKLNPSEYPERAVCFQMGRATAYTAIKDWASAAATLKEVQQLLPARHIKFAQEIQRNRFWLENRSLELVDDPDKKRPFEAMRYWGPFILVGDWR